MPEAMIHFRQCIQDSRDYGSDNGHMVSRVLFAIETDSALFDGLTCDVKQAVGSAFETTALEVSRPKGYRGSLDYAPFREAVESYYRSLVRSTGHEIHAGGGASSVRVRHNIIGGPRDVMVSYSDDSPAW